MFHGSSLFGFASGIVVFLALMLCFSSIRGKLVSEIDRWNKESLAVSSEMDAFHSNWEERR